MASAQGEQDPRCLLLVFRAVRSLVALLAGVGQQSAARLEEVCWRALCTVNVVETAPTTTPPQVASNASSDGHTSCSRRR